MSNQVAPINPNETRNLLAGIKGNLSSAFQVPLDESLSDGIGSSYGIIHYKGKVWSLSHRGASHLFTRPDDGSPASYIDVVILRQARTKSKSFYEGYDQDSASKRPICASLDGERPDMDAQTPQAQACAICTRNAWKTDAAGRRTKDCSDYKRVAVLLMPSVSSRMFNGVPLMEPVFLRVPAASLSDLSSFGDQLTQAGIPYFGIVTRVSFDPTKAHPQMQFRPLQGLTDAEGPVVLPLRDDTITKRIVGDDQPRQALPAGGQQILLPAAAAPQPQPQQLVAPQPQVYVAPQPQPQQFVAPQPQFVAPATVVQPTVMAPAPQVPQNAGDVGAPLEADAVLDGRLASLFPAA